MSISPRETSRDPNEPLLTNQVFNEFFPTVGAGVFLYDDTWYLGASIPNFLTGAVSEEAASLINDKIQFNMIGGYVFELSDRTEIQTGFPGTCCTGVAAAV